MMPYEDATFKVMKPADTEAHIPHQDDVQTPQDGNEYIGTKFLLPIQDEYQRATVSHRKRNVYEEIIGLCNDKPILDTSIYEDVLPGEEGGELLENQVDESILTSCDAEVNELMVFREILDNQSDEKAISK